MPSEFQRLLAADSKYCDAFSAERPDTIRFATKPIGLASAVITDISVNALEKACGFTFLRTVRIPRLMQGTARRINLTHQWMAKSSNPKLKAEADEHFADEKRMAVLLDKKATEKLIVCDMGDIGHGIFAGGSYAKKQMVDIYAGEMKQLDSSNPNHVSSDYYYAFPKFRAGHFNLEIENPKSAAAQKFYEAHPGVIDAKNYGSLSRLMQHLPTTKELKQHGVPEELWQHIAKENVTQIFIHYKGCQVIVFEASEEIKARQQVGYSYSYGYWVGSKKSFWLFNQKGEKYIKMTPGKTLEEKPTLEFTWLALQDRASYALENKRYEDALINLEQILKLRGTLPDRQTAVYYHNMSTCYRKQKTPNPAKADEYLAKSNELKKTLSSQNTDEKNVVAALQKLHLNAAPAATATAAATTPNADLQQQSPKPK